MPSTPTSLKPTLREIAIDILSLNGGSTLYIRDTSLLGPRPPEPAAAQYPPLHLEVAGSSRSGVGPIVTFSRIVPLAAPQGSLTPTQPGRITNPTQGHPVGRLGPPLRQSAGRSGVSPSHRPSTGSCHRARCSSIAGPGQRLPPCVHPSGS